MRNIALSDAGVKLSQATSHHSDFPPTNIIDKWVKVSFFWHPIHDKWFFAKKTGL